MTWLEWMGAGGISLPLMFLAYYALRRTKSAVEMCLKTYLRARAEREQRATMIAMAAALPEGGAAARFEEGQPAWLFYKHSEQGQAAIVTREAA
ncbi:hypothetical protein ACFVOO_32545 [Streptomyces rochei]|uniref:hypothetical protein n=1 Tax=Streptomyces TaxID=1883 RepID=UPI0004CB3EA6|nr:MULTISPECIES: hypothetical protein [Streptomyces]RSS67619.1 hypothetical protein EF911_34260 [Streptomyces sp. WAC06128]GGQ49644.1 hypothetical protein GCM10010279_68790 [Streptomyces mutabilis]